MTDKFLITQDDIRVYRPTAEIDEARLSPYITEAQNNDLKPVLNNALFYDFISKFDVSTDTSYSIYQDLLHGKAWTYNTNTEYFYGVKPMLCHYALARFVTGNPIQVTRFAVVKKISAQSEAATHEEVKMLANDLRSVAMSYQNDVIKFLENNTSTYTLYNTGGASNEAARRTSLNFFKL